MFDLNDTIYSAAYRHTLANNGGTFSPNDLDALPDGWPVFVLSLDDDRGVEMPLADFTITALTLFVQKNLDYINKHNMLDGATEAHKEIGTWVHDGHVYLDVVTLLPQFEYSRADVDVIARKHQQRAYFDMLLNENVFVDRVDG